MRVRLQPQPPSLEFNMTPMIDVVFLLIIFFLLSSHLASRETRMDLPLPTAATAELAEAESTPRITLNVTGEGQLFLHSNPINMPELGSALLQGVRQSGQDVQLRIRADRTVAYRHVGPILAIAAQHGIWDVTFVVHERRAEKGSPG